MNQIDVGFSVYFFPRSGRSSCLTVSCKCLQHKRVCGASQEMSLVNGSGHSKFMPSWENTLLLLLVSPRPSVWIPELSPFPEQDTSPNTRYQYKLCPPSIKNNSAKIALVEWLGVYLHRSPRYSDFAFRRLEYYHRLESDCYSNSYIRVAKCFRFALHHKRKPLFSTYFLTKKNWGLLWPHGFKAGVVTQACNPSMWEVEIGGSEI